MAVFIIHPVSNAWQSSAAAAPLIVPLLIKHTRVAQVVDWLQLIDPPARQSASQPDQPMTTSRHRVVLRRLVGFICRRPPPISPESILRLRCKASI